MLWSDLTDKCVGIWGMGREGNAAKQAIQKYAAPKKVIEISEDNLDDLNKCDVVIKSPGVSVYRDEIQKAKQAGVIFTSGTNLFFAHHNSTQKVIAITGTKGKSTTSSLLAHTLKMLGINVAFGGNIGVPLLDLLDVNADVIVTELSSYQCADFIGTPDIAMLVNLYPEHLQWHGSHERYWADKINMIVQARLAVLNATDTRTTELLHLPNALYFNREIHEDGVWFYDADIRLFPVTALALKGDHNRQNACAVLTVIKALGLDLKTCEGAFQTFEALPHRLQTIGQKDGLTFVDDSISTTPETAIAAIKAFDSHTPITLLVGGQDRGQDFTELVHFVNEQKGRVQLITLPDTGERAALEAQAIGLKTHAAGSMAEAVQMAKFITPNGGIVLLSPASPSYNLYKNFEERGADFKAMAFS